MEQEIEIEAAPEEEDKLGLVGRLARRLVAAEKHVAALERDLKIAEEDLRQIAEDELPKAMETVGMTYFGLTDGRRIEIKDVWQASVAAGDREKDPAKRAAMQARRLAWFAWLRLKKMDDVIKHLVGIEFDRGNDDKARDFVEQLRKDHPRSVVVDKEDINAQTLLALVREHGARGVKFPEELGVRHLHVAVVKKEKK